MKKLIMMAMLFSVMGAPVFAAGLATDPGFENGVVDVHTIGDLDDYYENIEYASQLWVYGSQVTGQPSGGNPGKYAAIDSGSTRGVGVVIHDNATSTGEWIFSVDLKDEGVEATTVTLIAFGLPDPWAVKGIADWRSRITPSTWVTDSLQTVPLLSQTVNVSGVTDWTTFTETIDLGETGYQYIALAIKISGGTSGNGLAIDNLDLLSAAPAATTFIIR